MEYLYRKHNIYVGPRVALKDCRISANKKKKLKHEVCNFVARHEKQMAQLCTLDLLESFERKFYGFVGSSHEVVTLFIGFRKSLIHKLFI